MITDTIALTDHHCHGVVDADLDRPRFERLLGEGPRGTFDSALGLAVRRFCAPVLDLPAHADADEYLSRRAELGWREVTTRLLRGAGVTRWLVDTGCSPEPDGDAGASSFTVPVHPGARHRIGVNSPAVDPGSPFVARRDAQLARFRELSGGAVDEVVRLEQVAEYVIAQRRHSPTLFAEVENALRERAAHAVAFKTVAAYRCGLDFPLVDSPPATLTPEHRIADPHLIGWLIGLGVRLGAELGLPLQFHTGFGDRDLRLDHADPLLLTDFLRATSESGPTVVLLHCWPFHRQASYLAHVFDHVRIDLGLTIPHIGARAGSVLAETLELVPFRSLCYSSDGFGLPELHYLGAMLWRRGIGRLVDEWIADDAITVADAETLVSAIASENARRIYPSPGGTANRP
ncbi:MULTISPECIES: amidohydrolase family protein [Nocardia]|uniref:amidohydrolase family protein n=1 Tax=Nocardia TaxID=1817 RepID=UPI001E54C644|nr:MULTISPECIES: amidohydrolase family protein [Nocardia]